MRCTEARPAARPATVIVLRFRTAVMICTPAANTSCFDDGVFNQMWLDQPGTHPIFAEEAGYGCEWARYITEHDALHHAVADELRWPFSYALHDGNGGEPLSRAPQRIQNEEHIVQRLQRLMMLGQPDPLHLLGFYFGPRLPALITDWAQLLDDRLGPIARPGLRG